MFTGKLYTELAVPEYIEVLAAVERPEVLLRAQVVGAFGVLFFGGKQIGISVTLSRWLYELLSLCWCCQEVDRYDDLNEELEKEGYTGIFKVCAS